MGEIIKVDFNSGKIIPLKDSDDIAAIQIHHILKMTVKAALSRIIENSHLSEKVKELATILKDREWFIQFTEDENG